MLLALEIIAQTATTAATAAATATATATAVDAAAMDAAQRLRESQHTLLAYAVALLLLWGYPLRIWLAGRTLKKRQAL